MLCQRLKARRKAPGSEKPSRKATSATESVRSPRNVSAVRLRISSRKLSNDVPSSEKRCCNVRESLRDPSSRFNTCAVRGRCQETPDLHSDTLLLLLEREDLRRFTFEPASKKRITTP